MPMKPWLLLCVLGASVVQTGLGSAGWRQAAPPGGTAPGAREFIAGSSELIRELDDHLAIPALLSCDVQSLFEPGSMIAQAVYFVARLIAPRLPRVPPGGEPRRDSDYECRKKDEARGHGRTKPCSTADNSFNHATDANEIIAGNQTQSLMDAKWRYFQRRNENSILLDASLSVIQP